jgi:hypothetical protein
VARRAGRHLGPTGTTKRHTGCQTAGWPERRRGTTSGGGHHCNARLKRSRRSTAAESAPMRKPAIRARKDNLRGRDHKCLLLQQAFLFGDLWARVNGQRSSGEYFSSLPERQRPCRQSATTEAGKPTAGRWRPRPCVPSPRPSARSSLVVRGQAEPGPQGPPGPEVPERRGSISGGHGQRPDRGEDRSGPVRPGRRTLHGSRP